MNLILSFGLSLFEDVPQTIVAMTYLALLYMDTGLKCYNDFAEYPQLTKMDINPKDSITVILLENPSIFFAVMMSMIMIVVNGFRTGFKMLSSAISKEEIEEGCGAIILPPFYILNLLCPIAAVAYYEIAPHFEKEWQPAFNLFVAGCVSWGLSLCYCCCLMVLNA